MKTESTFQRTPEISIGPSVDASQNLRINKTWTLGQRSFVKADDEFNLEQWLQPAIQQNGILGQLRENVSWPLAEIAKRLGREQMKAQLRQGHKLT